MGVLGGSALGNTLDGKQGRLPNPDFVFEPPDAPLYLISRLWNTTDGGLEGKLETGGGVEWGEWPLMTLPFPLVLLFCSTLAKAPAKDGPLSFVKGPCPHHYRLQTNVQCSLDPPIPPV